MEEWILNGDLRSLWNEILQLLRTVDLNSRNNSKATPRLHLEFVLK